jgi:hypothetical protein
LPTACGTSVQPARTPSRPCGHNNTRVGYEAVSPSGKCSVVVQHIRRYPRARVGTTDHCGEANGDGAAYAGPQSGPQSGPQLERHTAVDEVLRRADPNLETANLNVAALAWQARGPGFESPMLHRRNNELSFGAHQGRAPTVSVWCDHLPTTVQGKGSARSARVPTQIRQIAPLRAPLGGRASERSSRGASALAGQCEVRLR